jgi:SHS2 domain-containing protein
MIKTSRPKQDVTRTISLEAEDNENLLIEWLNELIYIIYTEKLVLYGFDILVDGGRLRAKCAGQRLSQGGPVIAREIKAATYHNLEIVCIKGIYSAKIIFDI